MKLFISGLLTGIAIMYGLLLATEMRAFQSPERIAFEFVKQRWDCSISDSSAFWWITEANEEAVVLELRYPFRREKYKVLQSELPRRIEIDTLPRKLISSDLQDEMKDPD